MEPSARFEEVEIPLREPVHDVDRVSGVLGIPEWWPTGSRIGIVIAHAQRADHTDPQIVELHRSLTERKFLTLRFNFPFAEAKRKNPDPLPALERCFRSAVAFLGRDPTAAPAHVFLGGKNLGALVAAQLATSRIRFDGLFLLGFPLHVQDRPDRTRAESLFRIIAPMLFVQGSKDRLCDLDNLRRTLTRVGAPTTLHVVEDGDHSFRVSKKSGRTPEDVQQELLNALESWIRKVLGG